MAKQTRCKLVIELAAKGTAVREICRSRGMSHHTVKDILDRARSAGMGWDDVRLMDEADVAAALYPEREETVRAIAQPDWDRIHSELAKPGVTLKLLWQEYAALATDKEQASVSYTSFTRGYSDWSARKRVTSHLEHKPGQLMEVDWSGSTMRLVDPVTGEVTKVYLFVAVLPYSQYTYVEAVTDMKSGTWLLCHVHAYEFFGGVAVRLVCDNLKTGVTSHPKEGEIVLNDAYESLARHYVCAVMPTGVRKPKHKPSVEGGVGKIATAVIARLRDVEFHDLESLRASVAECLADYNAAPFQKREGSRAEVFREAERPALSPLPDVPFEICEWVYGRKVGLDFHVAYKTNRYSVPSSLVGRKVDLKVGDSTVEAWCDGARVATHPRLPECARYRFQTIEAHMPDELKRAEWDDGRMVRWAQRIGPATTDVVNGLLGSVQIKEQAYNAVLAVLNLSKRYGDESLERACAYSLARVARPRCKFIRSVLASGAFAAEPGAEPAPKPGGYVRGASYYGKAAM